MLGKRWLTLLFLSVMQANVLAHCVLHFGLVSAPPSAQLDHPAISIAHLCDCAPASVQADGCDPNAADISACVILRAQLPAVVAYSSVRSFDGRSVAGNALARAPPVFS